MFAPGGYEKRMWLVFDDNFQRQHKIVLELLMFLITLHILDVIY